MGPTEVKTQVHFPAAAAATMETEMSNGDHWSLTDDLSVDDPEMCAIIRREKLRQKRGLELIASENFTSKSVLQCLGSCLNNKYSEGQVGQRCERQTVSKVNSSQLWTALQFEMVAKRVTGTGCVTHALARTESLPCEIILPAQIFRLQTYQVCPSIGGRILQVLRW